ncbi:peptide chain release factor 2 [Spirochaetales bacterium BR151]|uniref:Peptide chain release factor 2 n=1 Tax=Entomospira culicis TaxID=2719989 RepID=A0A968GEC3_9SPIO|nr:peptide chain release factor 2 [Entomospira culicis]NIZ68979.1 peptide chain release factor 2 [Entomospira culicis]
MMQSMKNGGVFDFTGLKREVMELELMSHHPDFWNDRQKAEATLVKIKKLASRYQPWEKLYQDADELRSTLEIVKELDDAELEAEAVAQYLAMQASYKTLLQRERLHEESDPLDAIITIHAGAGGTESCDWVRMLYRMYSRYVQSQGFEQEILDVQDDEGGYRDISFQVKGEYAYGLLKYETGIHRMVRISPFDAAARRHTSFASVYVTPVLDDSIVVEIKPDDVRIDTYRASGAGGQKVNKTSSAVRITHLATGIVVACQNERSQFRNKDIAYSILKGRLYQHYKAQRDQEREANAVEKRDIGFGSQTRNYVFQPYTLVKDVRTKAETSQIHAVMDGKIDLFIEAALEEQWTSH